MSNIPHVEHNTYPLSKNRRKYANIKPNSPVSPNVPANPSSCDVGWDMSVFPWVRVSVLNLDIGLDLQV